MVTMEHIAERVGVSRSTVSLVLNNRQRRGGSIGESTRQKILATANELGYCRNELARAVVTGKSRVLGVLTSDTDAENKARILTGVVEEASRHGYLIKVIHVTQREAEDVAVRRCKEWRLAGIVAVGLPQSSVVYFNEAAGAMGIPIAVFDDVSPGNWGLCMGSDDEQGVRLAIEHLTALGHQRIGFLSAQRDSAIANHRLHIYRAVMASLGLPAPDEYVAYGDWWLHEPTEQAVQHLILRPTQRPTAVVCAGDALAMSFARVARSCGLRVPHDISLVGYGDLFLARYADPQLTTIAQPFREIGRRAAEYLIDEIENEKPEKARSPESQKIATHLVVRASTAPPVK